MAQPAPPLSPDNPTFTIETSVGTMQGQLFAKQAPSTVANFKKYADERFFEGLIFHRVIKGFVIQGGGHEPSGRQKPAHKPIKLEVTKDLAHWDGALSMARTNVPDSATSQFYVCDGPQTGLDNQYAVFGIVTSGQDVVKKIASAATDRMDRPKQDVIIKKLTVSGS